MDLQLVSQKNVKVWSIKNKETETRSSMGHDQDGPLRVMKKNKNLSTHRTLHSPRLLILHRQVKKRTMNVTTMKSSRTPSTTATC